jgi:hypothetical protein
MLVRDDATVLNTEDVIMCCLVRDVAHKCGRGWNEDEQGKTEEVRRRTLSSAISSTTKIEPWPPQ